MDSMPNLPDRRAASESDSSPSGVDVDPGFRSLFDCNPSAVLQVDAQGRVQAANPALQRHFGHAPQALCGQPLSVLLPDLDRGETLAGLVRCRQPFATVLRHAGGRRCEVVVALLPTGADDAGAGSGYFLIARDISSHRRLQRQMQVQAEMLARTHEAVVVLDEVGDVVGWNDGAARLYDASAQAMAGRPFGRLFAAPDRARLAQFLIEASPTRSAPAEIVLRRDAPHGQAPALRLSLSRLAGVDPGRELWLVQGWADDACHPGHTGRRGVRNEPGEPSETADATPPGTPAVPDRDADLQQRLVRSAATTGQRLGRKAMLQDLADVLRVRVGAHQSAIWLLDGPERHPAVRAVSMSAKYPAWRRAGSGVFGAEALACLAWRMLDQTTVAQLAELEGRRPSPAATAAGTAVPRGQLAAPLFGGDGRVMGLLQVCDRCEGDFDAQDQAEILRLAQVASVALRTSPALFPAQPAAPGVTKESP